MILSHFKCVHHENNGEQILDSKDSHTETFHCCNTNPWILYQSDKKNQQTVHIVEMNVI